MPIPLKLADATTPTYEPVFPPPVAYAGVGVRSAPVRTRRRVAWDVSRGVLRRLGWVVARLMRLVPLTLALLGYAILFAGLTVRFVAACVGRSILWLSRSRPTRLVGFARSRLDRRVPFAQLA